MVETARRVAAYGEAMSEPDEATRRRIDAELRLQADPVLREAVRALEEYGQHRLSCHLTLMANPDAKCVCGLDAALARARGES